MKAKIKDNEPYPWRYCRGSDKKKGCKCLLIWDRIHDCVAAQAVDENSSVTDGEGFPHDKARKNALLIEAAVNAIYSINKRSPMKAAKNIKKLVNLCLGSVKLGISLNYSIFLKTLKDVVGKI